jgi:hypothetical protein
MSNSFIVRMKTWDEKTNGLVSRIQQGLIDNDLILGWSSAQGLVGEESSDSFKKSLQKRFLILPRTTASSEVQLGTYGGSSGT